MRVIHNWNIFSAWYVYKGNFHKTTDIFVDQNKSALYNILLVWLDLVWDLNDWRIQYVTFWYSFVSV